MTGRRLDILFQRTAIKLFSTICIVCGFSSQAIAGPMTSNLIIENSLGINAYYYEFSITNATSPIAAAQVRSSGESSFLNASLNTTSDRWFLSFPVLVGALIGPLDMRLTNDLGEVIQSNGLVTSFDGGAKFEFGQNFSQPESQSIPEPSAIFLLSLAMFLVLVAHTMATRQKHGDFSEDNVFARLQRQSTRS